MDYQHKPLGKFVSDTQPITLGERKQALYANMEVHPCKTMQDNMLMNKEKQELAQLSVLYGSSLPMRYVIERQIFGQTKRLTGYGSSMHALNMHMGRYDELDFFDILNDPYQNPERERVGVHARLEQEYGMN